MKSNEWKSCNKSFLESMKGPIMISWDITNRCNFSCKHCLNCSGDSEKHDFYNELSHDESMNIASQIVEIHPMSMCICGGEPTLRNDLEEIIAYISKTGTQVNMVSNGFLLNEERIKKLKRAGLSFLQISIDGADAETHDSFRNTSGAFIRAVNAVKYAVKHDIRVAVSICPTQSNLHKFNEYVDFIYELGCRHIRMMPFLPMGRGKDNNHIIAPSEDQYLELKIQIAKNRMKYGDMQIEWGDPLEHIYLAVHKPRPEPIAMEIRENGDIAPSIYLPISVGNALRHTLKEYWDHGFNRIWSFPFVYNIAKEVNTIDDFFDESLSTWNVKRRQIDIIDDALSE